MKIYLDSADLGEISKISGIDYIHGVTTNPTFFKEQGIKDEEEFINKLLEILPNKEIHLEAMGQVHEIINNVEKYNNLYKNNNFVYKIPCNREGLFATNLIKINEMEVKTNLHLVYSTYQALLAAKNGATYICPLMGKFEDEGNDPIKLIGDIKKVYDNYNIKTEIIVSSIRRVEHIEEILKIGVDGVTIPYKIFVKMHSHELTSKGIELFR